MWKLINSICDVIVLKKQEARSNLHTSEGDASINDIKIDFKEE